LAFIKGKARRLIVPMLVVGTLFAVFAGVVAAIIGAIMIYCILNQNPVTQLLFLGNSSRKKYSSAMVRIDG